MRLTYGAVLRRALTVGAIVGVVLAGYTFFVIEPVIEDAIELEDQLAAADPDGGGTHDDELFSRTTQLGGGLAATTIYAAIVAVIFGTIFAATRHRLPGSRDGVRAVWLAGVAFSTVALIPAIKYPANPPAVGDPDTVNERTAQYLVLLALSIGLAVVLTRVAGELRGHLSESTRRVVVAVITVATYGLVLAVMPATPDAVALEVPAGLLWDFRVRSLGGLGLLWAGIGFGLGWFLERDSGVTSSDHRTERIDDVAGTVVGS